MAGAGVARDWEEEGVFVNDEVEEGDEEEEEPMAATTRLKYSRFKGDGSMAVEERLCEFESIALANPEDPDAKRRIFQELLKEEALRWYQDFQECTRNNLTDFITLLGCTFQDAGGEVQVLGKLSWMTMRPTKSVRKYC